jgi:N-acetylmuramoyl-L-alanine amidase
MKKRMRNNQPIKLPWMSTLLALLLMGASGEATKADLYVGDALVKSFTSYQVIDDTVFLPLAEAAAALGVKGYADASTQAVYLQWDQDLIVISTEQRSARRGGEITPLKFTPIWTAREVYVPHQVFTEVLAKAKGQSIRAVHPALAGAALAPSAVGFQPAPSPAASYLRNPVDVIVLDPGHGGHDPGAKGPGGLLEKDVVLTIAQKLQARLQNEPGLSAPLTRDGDTFIPLAERPASARRLRADLFVSIHANAARYISAQGFETFFASLNASDQTAFDLARLENQEQAAPDGPDPVRSDLESILGSMAQSEHLSESQHIAELVQRELAGALASDDRGVKQAPFRVLMDSTTPAILVEVGFISSPSEARTITDPEVQDRIVAAIARALCRYRDETNQRLGLAPKG